MAASTTHPAAAATTLTGVLDTVREIHGWMSAHRRRQLWTLFGLILLGAMFELLTIGAVVPFLSVLAGGEGYALVSFPGPWSAGGMPRDQALAAVTLMFAALAVIGAAARVALAWFGQKFAFRVGHDLATVVFSRMLRQPYSYYVQSNTSEVISGVEKVQVVIYSVILPAIQTLIASIMAVFIIALLVAINPLAALTAFAFMSLVYFFVSIGGRKILRRNSQIVAEMHRREVQQIQEGLGGIRDILLDRSQGVFEASFTRIDHELREAQATNVVVSNTPRVLIEAAGIVLISLLALYLSGLPGGVVAAIPVLGALALGAQRLLPLLHIVYLGWSHITGSAHVLFDVVRLLRLPVAETSPAASATPFRDRIGFHQVSFRYAARDTPALSEIDLTIPRGERLGIIGPTGSGKSTLLDLLMGLLEPTEGEIRVDDVELGQASLGGWQAQIAHVPQFIYLADSSIASNIAFGEASEMIDMDRVREAAAAARLASFVEELPDEYRTWVGERGIRLSGGQRQRIGIARALYKRASFLIFDEATSALDDETEAAVMTNLGSLDRDLTLVIVAHRQSSLARCDRIVRLHRGRIEEVGGYDEVIGCRLRPRPAARKR